MARKLIVTSASRLRSKYADAGWKRIDKGLDALIAADAARGLETTVVSLAVKKGASVNAFKTAIDAAFRKAGRPEYLLILGGPDIIPHQELTNPTGDEDEDVPSDLPYASEAKAGSAIDRFTVASRVVGRLPDKPESDDPGLLLELVERAAAWKPLSRTAYRDFFGLTAAVWKKSTTLSLRALFGQAAAPRNSPAEGPIWKKAQLAARAHFINCHGAASDPQFYGQSGQTFPVAHQSVKLTGLVKPGTVVAAECCYGGELYAPGNGVSGICTTYLAEGAIGFLGSTNIAYGPADDNAAADLICQFFLQAVLGGASLGRALLAARQRYLNEVGTLSPIDLKTLAQFYLLGDPSVHPVAEAAPKSARARSTATAKRRAVLESNAAELSSRVQSVGVEADRRAPRAVGELLSKAAEQAGLVPTGKAVTYEVRRPNLARPKAAPLAVLESAPRAARKPTGTKFHLMWAVPRDATPAPKGVAEKRAAAARFRSSSVCSRRRSRVP